ncbi:hypothetical protein LTR70_004714 [Exophiala xenobiotica]|uniref:Histidinol-phosphatase n=1 Tax=Lithohypha guttulata TaxID=1690604 RepID=A0ABR0KE24_9EURO|nr:hypothetical protein LTR24_004330 [Lithohypha guttulata]KAK5319929.1 hypothetical protein LTR70_004714 [Exophiala xenobiotica]
MPFSHHSHSGQFCPGHAQDALEDVIKAAISKGFQVFALTEHMPRHDQDRYPEEIEAGSTMQSLMQNESGYVKTALELREKYQDRIALPLGFESDWCGQHSLELIERSIRTYPFDFFMGSIHHVAGVPIDFDQAGYDRARDLAGGTDEKLFEQYFDEQLAMLQAIRPPVVGHFDLIRLKSGNFDIGWRTVPNVWIKILRNLDFVASYGGILEINTAALRKGMTEPYPKSEICQEFLRRQGRFCLSDDSHGVAQVGTNYEKLLPFLEQNDITTLCFLTHVAPPGNAGDGRFPTLCIRSVAVCQITAHEAFQEPRHSTLRE